MLHEKIEWEASAPKDPKTRQTRTVKGEWNKNKYENRKSK